MYIDTANLDEIKKALKTGIVKGVTTNTTILKKENKKMIECLQKDYKQLVYKSIRNKRKITLIN